MSPITQISIERDCFGCAHGMRVVLHADGSAQRLALGKARHGTLDALARGVGSAANFAALARLVDAQQFFTMDDTYQDPGLSDGAWTVVSVTRGGQQKSVFRRDDAGPDALKQIESGIDEVASAITFADAPG